jgi:hypothetical protein
MANHRVYQTFDETTSGGTPGSRRGERRTRTRARTPEAPPAQFPRAEAVREPALPVTPPAEVLAEEVRVYAPSSTYGRRMQTASEKLGRMMGRVRHLRRQDLLEGTKDFIRDNPKSIFAALAAGFLVGRLLRRT